MRLPTTARPKILSLAALGASLLVGACAGETTAPTPSASASQSVASPFVPTAAEKSLVGVEDGTYEFTVNPRQDQALALGANLLNIPKNAICDIARSSYGVGHWNESCTPERSRLTITAVVKNAKSAHPSIDFSPAMRFSPSANVTLYMYVPLSERTEQHDFVMKYCNDAKVCVDESLTDPTLRTMTDRTNSMVFRRIKHFSGYIIWGVVSDVTHLLF